MPDRKKILSLIASNTLFIITFAILLFCLYYGVSFSTLNKQMNTTNDELRIAAYSKQTMLTFIESHLIFFIALLVIILLFASLHLSYPTKCTKTLNFITSNWLFLSAIILLLGCLFYSISPLYTLEAVKNQQQQEGSKNEFIKLHNRLGTELLKIEKVTAARDEFKQVLQVDPSNLNATMYLVECDMFNKTENSTSDPVLENKRIATLYSLNNSDPMLNLYLANHASDYNNSTEAIRLYNRVLDIDPTVPAAYEGLGVLYSRQGNLTQALDYFKEAVRLYDDNVDYQTNLATTLYELKRYPEAITAYDRIGPIKLKTDPLALSTRYKTTFNWYNSSLTSSETLSQKPSLDSYLPYSNTLRCMGELNKALNIQEQQIKIMEDNNTTDMPINQRPFSYCIDAVKINLDKCISLESYDMKRYYFYYNIALTYYLLDNKDKVAYYVNKANDLNIDSDSESKVKNFVNLDIETFKNAPKPGHEDKNKANEFKNKFVLSNV